jgi:hypothetical protein
MVKSLSQKTKPDSSGSWSKNIPARMGNTGYEKYAFMLFYIRCIDGPVVVRHN